MRNLVVGLRCRFALRRLPGRRRGLVAGFLIASVVVLALVPARFLLTIARIARSRVVIAVLFRTAVFGTLAVIARWLAVFVIGLLWAAGAAKQVAQPRKEAALGRFNPVFTGFGSGFCWAVQRSRWHTFQTIFAFFARRRRAVRFDRGHGGRSRNIQVGPRQRVQFQFARRSTVVARTDCFLAEFTLTNALHIEMRRFHLFVGDDHDGNIVAFFDFNQRTALFVEEEVRDFVRCLHQHLAGVVLHRLLFNQT
ncbi:MAG: hypothetical protein BWZ07_02634 [Alphaproteobacteria bacterium ADurb.BinA280]|nr:MAG: hypothetical protein BWZ07_02634 [Alphaproteobacteria bacterium ADurb.BinA280]